MSRYGIVAAFFLAWMLPQVGFAQQCVEPPGFPDKIYNARGNGMIITYYVPIGTTGGDCRNTMQGCIATSCKGVAKVNNEYARLPTCLDAVRLGQAQYVTLASDWSNQGKYFHLGDITYISALDNQKHTVRNVIGYVHDTGCAFTGTCSAAMRARYGFSSVPRPDKLDVCVTTCPWCTDAQASALASGKNVSIAYSSSGIVDPGQFRPTGYTGSISAMSPALGAYASQGAYPGPSSAYVPNSAINPNGTPSSSGTQPQSSPLPSGANTTQRSAGIVLAQPGTVRRGQSLVLSWSSVGMRENSCMIRFKDGEEIARTNNGTQRLVLPSEAATGSLAFEFSCTPPEGGTKTAEATVSVQP
ncbi:MAG TPA: hypothetical protein VNM40_00515 [Candidatus Paceibacterota bacterium]|nr:hypothetical protein [Candidatus Paceibacterota bacterium]